MTRTSEVCIVQIDKNLLCINGYVRNLKNKLFQVYIFLKEDVKMYIPQMCKRWKT